MSGSPSSKTRTTCTRSASPCSRATAACCSPEAATATFASSRRGAGDRRSGLPGPRRLDRERRREPRRADARHRGPGRPGPPVGPRHASADRRAAPRTYEGRQRRGPLHAGRQVRPRRLCRRERLPLGSSPVGVETPGLRGGGAPAHTQRVAGGASRSRLRTGLLRANREEAARVSTSLPLRWGKRVSRSLHPEHLQGTRCERHRQSSAAFAPRNERACLARRLVRRSLFMTAAAAVRLRAVRVVGEDKRTRSLGATGPPAATAADHRFPRRTRCATCGHPPTPLMAPIRGEHRVDRD